MSSIERKLKRKNATKAEKNAEKDQQERRFSQRTVFVREDDQDWGSSGMNDIQKALE